MGGLPTDRTVYAIHSHPKLPQRLLAALQEGLYRSEDGAKTWHKVDLPVASPVVSFAHHPENLAKGHRLSRTDVDRSRVGRMHDGS